VDHREGRAPLPWSIGRRSRVSSKSSPIARKEQRREKAAAAVGTCSPASCDAATAGQRCTTLARKTVYDKYICSTYHVQGKSECQHHAVDQASLTNFIVRRLRERLLDGQTKDELRATVRRPLAEESAPAKPADLEALKKKLAECNNRVEKWTENVLDADPAVKDLLSERLAELRRDRDRLADELATMDRASGKPRLRRSSTAYGRWRTTCKRPIRPASASFFTGSCSQSNFGSAPSRAARELFTPWQTASCNYGRIKSSKSYSRDNRTAIELFAAGVRRWETRLRRDAFVWQMPHSAELNSVLAN
jgi:hypothetical protein